MVHKWHSLLVPVYVRHCHWNVCIWTVCYTTYIILLHNYINSHKIQLTAVHIPHCKDYCMFETHWRNYNSQDLHCEMRILDCQQTGNDSERNSNSFILNYMQLFSLQLALEIISQNPLWSIYAVYSSRWSIYTYIHHIIIHTCMT